MAATKKPKIEVKLIKGDGPKVPASFSVALKAYEQPKVSGKVKAGIAIWGEDNNFPLHSLRSYNDSVTNGSIIGLKQILTSGKTVVVEGIEDVKKMFPASSPAKFTEAIALDYWIHNTYCYEVGYTRDGSQIAWIKHIDISTVRKLMNDDGEVTGYKIALQWNTNGSPKSKARSVNPFDPEVAKKELGEIFQSTDPLKTFENAQNKTQLVWVEYYTPGAPTYPMPKYWQADVSIQFEVSYGRFHLNGVNNGFRPTVFIEAQGNWEDSEKRKEIQNDLKRAMSPEGSNAFVQLTSLNGTETGEGKRLHVTPVDNHYHDGKFSTMAAEAKQAIITAHNLTSPTVAGLPGAGSLGGNGKEIQNALTAFVNLIILPAQERILESITATLHNAGHENATISIEQLDAFAAIGQYMSIVDPTQAGDGQAKDSEGTTTEPASETAN